MGPPLGPRLDGNMATFQSLPPYLQKYCTTQDYDRYSPEDHAAWRYIMRQSREFFKKYAVSDYLKGCEKTGIPLDRIPRISDMDKALNRFGWGAVPVCGFLPPAAFLDFQARKVLPIATDMRTISHIAYTPAPDIVHEAAGHAPILAQPAYARYLSQYATLAQKAIFSDKDIALYQAIRILSDIKENPDGTAKQIAKAEADLKAAASQVNHVSEASKVARMNWWTAEYGLSGTLKNPKIYGAGLLSSVGESQNCLSAKVKKIPFSIDCIEVSYNITEPQPQLFVTPDLETLSEVLKDLEKQMSYQRGGVYGLDEAKRCQTLATVVINSGIAVSGIVSEFEKHRDSVEFVRFKGPVQLSFADEQLPGHGTKRHPDGFSSPLGNWKTTVSKDPSRFTDSELAKIGIAKGKSATLKFANGFEVKGKVAGWLRKKNRLLLITWKDCQVTRGDKVYFQPAWGEFDMLVGTEVPSVYGGPADREAYGDYEMGLAETQPGRKSPFSASEKKRFAAYTELRQLRGSKVTDQTKDKVEALVARYAKDFPDEWLIKVELIEVAHSLLKKDAKKVAGLADFEKSLLKNKTLDKTHRWLAEQGVALAKVPDSKF